MKTTIFQCSKNYDSPTRVTMVTRLKDAPDMADKISVKDSISRLNKNKTNKQTNKKKKRYKNWYKQTKHHNKPSHK